MRIVSVVGTRPQLIKAAALSPAARDRAAKLDLRPAGAAEAIAIALHLR